MAFLTAIILLSLAWPLISDRAGKQMAAVAGFGMIFKRGDMCVT